MLRLQHEAGITQPRTRNSRRLQRPVPSSSSSLQGGSLQRRWSLRLVTQYLEIILKHIDDALLGLLAALRECLADSHRYVDDLESALYIQTYQVSVSMAVTSQASTCCSPFAPSCSPRSPFPRPQRSRAARIISQHSLPMMTTRSKCGLATSFSSG